MKIKNIWVPYDGTVSNKKSFDYALGLAKKHNAKIFIFTCIPEQPIFVFFKSKTDKKIVQNQKNQVEKQIDTLRHKADNAGVSFASKIMLASKLPSECILKYSTEKKIDLIVMSTKRGSPGARMYYDSTVENVFKHAVCSFNCEIELWN